MNSFIGQRCLLLTILSKSVINSH